LWFNQCMLTYEPKLSIQWIMNKFYHVNLHNGSKKSKLEWQIISASKRLQANGKCQICGSIHEKLYVHERFAHDDAKHKWKLIDVTAVCWACHNAMHLVKYYQEGDKYNARRYFSGRQQLKKINDWSESELNNYIVAKKDQMKLISHIEYQPDLSEKRNILKQCAMFIDNYSNELK
jgi:hypothetical protein